jgi:hypothetical protein
MTSVYGTSKGRSHRASFPVAAVLLGLVLAPGAMAQSLFSAGGLGLPGSVPDARARMLGGVEMGLPGLHASRTDPASASALVLAGISLSMESSVESLEGGETTTGRTRFPGFSVGYPYRGLVYSVGYTGLLSQDWRGVQETTLDFGEGGLVEAEDRFQSTGSFGTFHAGVSRRIGSQIGVGANVGIYTGALERNFFRELNPDQVGLGVEPYVSQGRWRAKGLSSAASVNWQVHPLVHLGAGVVWSGDLTLDPIVPTPGEALDIPLPLEVRFGGLATLAPDLRLAASISRADWSEAAEAIGDEAGRGELSQWGLGVTWEGSRFRQRRVPMAVGYRSTEHPFSFLGQGVKETAVTGGIGLHLASTEDIPLAHVHVGLERGNREAGSASESFLRAVVTFRVWGR